MIKFHLQIIVLLLGVAITSFGQERQELEELYRDANAYFYFEDYEEALALYLEVYDFYPDNFNLDYRMGICYLNIPGRKHLSIPHLERASKNTTRRYSETSLRETQAPVDAIFYLGNAYYANNELKKAKEAYDMFRSQIRNERRFDMDYLNHQLAGLERARMMQNFPVNFLRLNLGPNINNRFSNFNAVISGDGKTLAYTTQERFYQAIMVARKEEDDNWGKPQNITLDLVVDGDCSTLSLSYDGKELYLFKDDDHVGNIYVTTFDGVSWSPMRKLNENINTEYYETHASVSSDGKKLYFTSNRAGGYGDLDIYVSERTENRDWGPAKNIGPNVNSRFNENTPFITNDGKTLFFSSEGHNTIGGYDIFFSQLQSDGTWSKPVNLGYPINTTENDLFYFPIDDGSQGLMAIFDPKGYGQMDITQIEIFLPRYQRSIVTSSDYVERRVDLPEKTLIVDTVNISGVALLDPTKPEHVIYLATDKRYTLFFDGKPYDLRDQSKLAPTIAARLSPTTTPLKIEHKSLPRRKTTPVETDDFLELDSALAHQLEEIDQTYPKEIEEPTDSNTTSVEKQPESTHELTDITESFTNQSPSDESLRLAKILNSIANKKVRASLTELMSSNWQIPSASLKIRANELAYIADSLGLEEQYIEMFSILLDVVGGKISDRHVRQSRQISQISNEEDFFFHLQRIKKNASFGLAKILEDAVLTQPKITSFHTLWEYLNKEQKEQIAPYKQELLALIAESGIEGYFTLNPEQREDVYKKITKKYHSITGLIIISILALVAFFMLVTYLKKNKQRKSIS